MNHQSLWAIFLLVSHHYCHYNHHLYFFLEIIFIMVGDSPEWFMKQPPGHRSPIHLFAQLRRNPWIAFIQGTWKPCGAPARRPWDRWVRVQWTVVINHYDCHHRPLLTHYQPLVLPVSTTVQNHFLTMVNHDWLAIIKQIIVNQVWYIPSTTRIVQYEV